MLAAVCVPAVANAEQDKKGIAFFEKKIRPLFAKHCFDCHGPDEQKSGLRLDTWEGIEEGGDTGESLLSEDVERSLLLVVLEYELDDLMMPPDGKLSDSEIADVKRWLEMDAPHPDRDKPKTTTPSKPETRSADVAEASDHWSFQPIERPALPPVHDTAWVRTEIDRFILSRLESQGISPSREAEKATLIRRATLDLWGLPPTPKQVEAFVSDASEDAYERLIERLLAAPQYGERWGRHWLDVARYADSNGLDENIAHGNAWRYRDYVVRAFNHDKPFDRFVHEQLAGDLLPAETLEQRNESLVATGFLSLGPKVLAEGDLQKMEMDIIDEQIDTLGRAFLGLTLGCARCHDHKFDPIATEDYYGLAGVFKSTQTMEDFKRIARWYEHSIACPEDHERLQKHEAKLQDARQRATRLLGELTDALPEAERKLAEKERIAKFSEKDRKRLEAIRAQVAALEASLPELPTAMGVSEGEVADLHVHIRGSHLSLGKLVPRRLPTVLAGAEQVAWPKDSSGRTRLAHWLTSRENPLTRRVIVNRIWRWHFGQGLCDSPDNFGLLSQPPSHPLLLDWLADELSREGWSLKSLHRKIMRSSVYRQGGRMNSNAVAKDPENRFYWRFEPRRLEAEAIRDALLYVAGQLDQSFGGSLLHVKNREFFFNHLSKDTTSYESPRRSLYLPVVRNNLYDVFSLFDYSDASMMNGDRASTTVAPQALFMLNSDLVDAAAAGLAAKLIRSESEPSARVALMFAILFGRAPERSETESLLRFVDGTLPGLETEPPESREWTAWKLACQIGLASNEFVYLR